MAYARITLNNSSPLLMFRHRVTAPHPLANSFRLVGKYWHRYFQSVFTMFLFHAQSIHQPQELSIPYSSANEESTWACSGTWPMKTRRGTGAQSTWIAIPP